MSLVNLYMGETLMITADDQKHHVLIELSTSGYRPKYVSMYVESEKELEEIINALNQAKQYLIK